MVANQSKSECEPTVRQDNIAGPHRPDERPHPQIVCHDGGSAGHGVRVSSEEHFRRRDFPGRVATAPRDPARGTGPPLSVRGGPPRPRQPPSWLRAPGAAGPAALGRRARPRDRGSRAARRAGHAGQAGRPRHPRRRGTRAAPGVATRWSAVALKAAEQNPRLLIDEPGSTANRVLTHVVQVDVETWLEALPAEIVTPGKQPSGYQQALGCS